jgi:hypothetical protein
MVAEAGFTVPTDPSEQMQEPSATHALIDGDW